MAHGSGAPLQTLILNLGAGSPLLVRDRRIVVVAGWAESTAAAKAYLQFHNLAATASLGAGRVPEFILPLLVGAIAVLDGYHYGVEGVAFDSGLVIATSSTAATYTAVAASAGSWVQLGVK